jgi:hypothetical protein
MIAEKDAAFSPPPEVGQIVQVRTRRFLVDRVEASPFAGGAVVGLLCVDDDAQGQALDVVWDLELEKSILDRDIWKSIGIGWRATKYDRSHPVLQPNRRVSRLARPLPVGFALIEDAPLPSSPVASDPIFRSRRCGRRPQPGDKHQGHVPRHGDLGHLEGDVAAVAHDLGAELDQLLARAGQRRRLDRLWHRQRPHEVAEVV